VQLDVDAAALDRVLVGLLRLAGLGLSLDLAILVELGGGRAEDLQVGVGLA
jgi:hypothetical protein